MLVRIYYGDGSVRECRTRAGWRRHPDDGVQAVVRFPRRDPVRWHCEGQPVLDRDIWTGHDGPYDPFGWGPKNGTLIRDDVYLSIWRRACADRSP